MTKLEKPAPIVDNWNRPFWEACRERRLLLQRCSDSWRFFYPPAPVSPFTGKRNWEWRPVTGRGEIWSFVIFHQKYFAAFADELPYLVAMVRLDEGPYLLTNIRGQPNAEVRIGQRVHVVFEPGPGDFLLPQFSPIKEQA